MASSYSAASQVVDPEVFVFPASFAQERLWFLDQYEPESAFYNIPITIGLSGAVNREALRRTLLQMMRRHEGLRTTFALVEGRPVQVIHPELPLLLPFQDLGYLSNEQREREMQRLTIEQARAPFDLRHGPLFRGLLVRLSPAQHVLLLTMHHIISDGWSMGIFFQEFKLLYEAAVQGREAQLPDLPIQYADFAQWQREWLQGAVLEQLLNYWRRQLAGAPAVLELPLDHPRPPLQTFRGATRVFAIDEETAAGLASLSQREGVTLFMTLLAAFKTLLYRYTGQTDLVVGTPIANRNRAELEGLIGFFVNTLVLRTHLSGELTFTELLRRVRGVTLGAYEHQDLPFEKLVEELQPERHLNHSPLFQVFFSIQNAPTFAKSGEISQPSLKDLENSAILGTSKFDLALFTEETDQNILAGLEYNTDLFDPTTIERMASHFQTLVASIVANPDARLSSLKMLSDGERRLMLKEWNATTAAYPEQATLSQLFEAQVEQTPEVAAVTTGETSLSYREFNQRANQLAHYLASLGVEKEMRVGVCLERSMELVLGMLGVLKCGAAYMPLDPLYPRERLSFMIADSGATVVLTKRGLVDEPAAENVKFVYLDSDWEEIAQQSTENPAVNSSPDNLAYIIYTSGSTGTPKGVAMAHRPIVNLISWQNRKWPLPAGARTLQFASPSFDVSVQEMLSTWLGGGTLFLLTEEDRRDLGRWLQVVFDSHIERLFIPPVMLQQLAEMLDGKAAPEHLRQIIVAGEQLQITEPIVRLFRKLKNCTLHNHYGPTESHVVTEHVLDGEPGDWPMLPPIGRPIANTKIYLLDAEMQPAPLGVPAELHIGGVALAQGYLGRPELTDKKFVPNPFSDNPGERLYKTGDLARYRLDGAIEYLGRLDRQVKLRGFRIELGEIEAVLLQHPAVQEAVAMVRTDAPGDQRLVAYLVAANGNAPSTPELLRFLKEKLPDYMVPSLFIPLESIPLTANGKVDRNRLPAPDKQRPELEHRFVSPRTAMEQTLAEIWTNVLKIERVGVFDNFFELGGHSLLATQVVSRVREALHVELPLRDLFEYPTIAAIAVSIICQRAKQEDPGELARALAELEQLSDSDARALLGQ